MRAFLFFLVHVGLKKYVHSGVTWWIKSICVTMPPGVAVKEGSVGVMHYCDRSDLESLQI